MRRDRVGESFTDCAHEALEARILLSGDLPAWTHLSSNSGDLPETKLTGNQQTASLVLDIDNDGVDDFVITERSEGPSVVWFGRDGDGWTEYVIDNNKLAIEAGGAFSDIDGDGDLDLVFAGDYQSNQIWWWENPYPNYDANTPWTRRTIKNSGSKKHHDQIFADFDGDGVDEFVTWNQDARQLLFGEIPANPKSTSSWTLTSIYTAGGTNYEGLAAADINLDGVLDIVGAGRWFEHTGGSSFTAHTIDSSAVFTRAAAGQLIPGGQPEVLFGPGDADGALKMYEWDGDSWTSTTLISNIRHGHSLQIEDVNLDGHLDIFIAEMYSPGPGADATARILYGDSAGGFDEQVISVGIGNHESRLGDLDGDGDFDILTKPYSWDAPRVDVWLNELPRTLDLDSWDRHVVDASRPWTAVFVDAADIDGDGAKDIVTGGWWYRNPGDAGGSWTRNTIGSPLNNYAAAYDFDGDGDIDLLGTEGKGADTNDSFVWAENDGSGSFAIHHNVASGDGDFLQGVAVDRFTPGGPIQVALSWHAANKGVQMLTVPADPTRGTWGWEKISSTSQDEGLSAGDIDRDGDLDLLLGTQWLRNDGSGWSAFTLNIASGMPDRNRLADVNGDGRLDAVVGYEAISTAGKLAWYEQPSSATGTWTEHVISSSVIGPMSVDATDLDLDGDIDVIVGEHNTSNPSSAKLWVLENTDGEGGAWASHLVHTGDEHHDGAVTTDIDGDGDRDIISIGWTHNRVMLYENTSPAIPGGNRAPTASDDSFTVAPGGSYAGMLEADDLDAADSLTYEIVDSPGHGTILSLNPATGAFAYAPATGYEGPDQFTFAANDGEVDSNIATVTIHVELVNLAPEVTITSPTVDVAHLTDDNSLLVLEATVTDDGVGGGGLGYGWSVIDAPAGGVAAFGDAAAADTTVRFAGDGTYVLRLAADDGVNVSSDDITVEVGATSGGNGGPTPDVAWWKFDEGTGSVATDSIGGHDGTVAGAFWSSQGIDGSLYFDGVNDAVQIGSMDISGSAMTLAAWIRAEDFEVYDARIISKADGVQDSNHWWMLSTLGDGTALRLRLKTNGTTDTLITSNGVISAEQWRHVAATYDGSRMRIFVDGQEVGSMAKTGSLSTNASVQAAIGNNPSGVEGRPFDGRIDDVRIYNTALDAAEIAAIMTGEAANTAPTVDAGADRTVSGSVVTLDGAVGDDGSPAPPAAVALQWVQVAGPAAATLADDTSADTSVALPVVGEYTFRLIADDGEVKTADEVTLTLSEQGAGDWWNDAWAYRMGVTVEAAGVDRSDKPAEIVVDFGAAMAAAGQTGQFDPASIRVVEVDASGLVIDAAAPFQFDPAAATPDAGTLVFMLTGDTPADSSRSYQVYFDVADAGHAPAPVASQVDITDGVAHKGFDSYRIETADGTWYYHKAGGGFATIEDGDGNDWIGFENDPASLASGWYRGVPNAVYPEDAFHPGRDTVTSTLVSEGPLKVTIRSVSNDGAWESLWEVYPTYATMTMVATDHDYWFQYEGAPGGQTDNSDYIVRSDGSVTTAAGSFTQDVNRPGADEEWVYVGDASTNRALFAAHHQDDSASDRWYKMAGPGSDPEGMTIFAFGRGSGTDTQLTSAGQHFTIGFVNDDSFDAARGDILGAYKPLTLTAGLVETRPADTIAGDFDLDGDVDLDDFFILKSHFGATGATRSIGDANADGVVDLDDFFILKSNFGATAATKAAPAVAVAAESATDASGVPQRQSIAVFDEVQDGSSVSELSNETIDVLGLTPAYTPLA